MALLEKDALKRNAHGWVGGNHHNDGQPMWLLNRLGQYIKPYVSTMVESATLVHDGFVKIYNNGDC